MHRIWIAPLVVLGALAGCSPTLNWRSVPLDGSGLTVTLPCKPDHATRSVDLGGSMVDLTMTGCDTDGATFAVSHMRQTDPARAGAMLGQWRAAVLARMRATGDPSGVLDAPFVPPGALNLPQSVRSLVTGQRPGGGEITAQAVWFARLEGTEARLYHAVVYTATPQPQVADTFFGGLALR